MFRVSNLLRNARLDKELDFTEISKKIKIPVKYLDAIENEKIKDFPAEPYCSLIVKDYANFLGLNGEEILSLFRRDFDRKISPSTKKNLLLGVTPRFTFTVGVFIAVVVFSGYLMLEYFKYNRPPKLDVSWPSESSISGNSLEINGTTDPESTVRVNQDLVIVDQSGSFQKKVNIGNSDLKIVVESKSPSGKTSTLQKTYQPKP